MPSRLSVSEIVLVTNITDQNKSRNVSNLLGSILKLVVSYPLLNNQSAICEFSAWLSENTLVKYLQ